MPDMARLAATLAVSALLTLALVPVVLVVLHRRSIVDSPNERSSHLVPTPRGAGFAQAVGLAVALAVTWVAPVAAPVAALGFSAIGMADDLRPRRAALRLVLQGGVAVVVVVLLYNGGDRGLVSAALLAVVSVVWLLYIVNATNFMDGVNGISIAHGVVFGLAYAAILWNAGAADWSLLAVALVGVSLAVFPWNWGRSARVFLGDSGSYLLGGSVGALALAACLTGAGVIVALAPVAVYLADTLSTLIWRAGRREPLMTAHRDHVYQRLVRRGWTHPQTALTVVGFSAGCAVVALLLQRGSVSAWVALILLAGVVAVYLALPRMVRAA